MKLVPWRRQGNGTSLAGLPTPMARFDREMDSLVDRFFRDPWGAWFPRAPFEGIAPYPPMDVSESADEVRVSLELPGVEPSDVDVSIAGDCLTVRSEKKEERVEGDRDFRYMESRTGSFERRLVLPDTVDTDKVDARFKNGVLTIRIPKRADARPKQIEVHVS